MAGRGWRGDLALAVLAPALALCLALTGWLDRADEAVYDRAVLRGSVEGPAPVVLVAIDEPAFLEFGEGWPWPRSRHAALIESLRAAGARTIAIDLLFTDPTTPEADAALTAALGPDVMLAADVARIDTPQGVITQPVDPLPAFRAAGAGVAQIALPLDEDGAIRRLATDAAALAPRLAGRTAPEGARIRFAPGAIPRVSYYQALRAATDLPPDVFHDRTVLVGFALRSAPLTAADTFRTPLTTAGLGLTPGVEIHAHATRSLIAGDWITPLPRGLTAALALLLAAAAALPLPGRSALGTATLTTALALVALGGSVALLSFGFWLPPAAPALAALAAGAGRAGLDLARERRARREITRIFGQYLAPDLVRHLAAHPEQVKLGGERRLVTVMFCDLRGFTRLTESFSDDPETLTAILNRALTVIGDSVLENGGLIDKFIGDCVMGLWNAPAEDPDHADHAIAAARAAVAGIAALSDTLAAEGLPVALACGVGLNSGPCTIGNLGTARRFDYTAIGDAVNVASRLEVMTKELGLPILVGEGCAALTRHTALREIRMTAIRGRTGMVRVFAPADGDQPLPRPAQQVPAPMREA
ncbi:CHASE2 domain-containing protein [Pseudooceanicola sp.]|uniref:CHASE2 domain-containing protein n=1 Tax=Pseudooceanicola sp. TaxID=1914328 RepID=UPI004059961D